MPKIVGRGYAEVETVESEEKKKAGLGAIAFNCLSMLVLLLVFTLASVALLAIFARLMLGFFGISPVSTEFISNWGATGLGLLSAMAVTAISTWRAINRFWTKMQNKGVSTMTPKA